jgi:tetratricopeptide (TPR) repeat protein
MFLTLFACKKKEQDAQFQSARENSNNNKPTIEKKKSLYYSEGYEKLAQNDFIGSLYAFTEEINANPNDFSPFSGRGEAKMQLKDYRGAIADFNRSIELIDDEFIVSTILKNRGISHYHIKNYKLALQDLNLAIEMYERILKEYDASVTDPEARKLGLNRPAGSQDWIDAYYWRGHTKIALNRKNDGCLDFSKAGELGYILAYGAIAENCN